MVRCSGGCDRIGLEAGEPAIVKPPLFGRRAIGRCDAGIESERPRDLRQIPANPRKGRMERHDYTGTAPPPPPPVDP